MPNDRAPDFEEALATAQAKLVEANETIAKLRVQIKQNTAQIERLANSVVERRGPREVEALLREIVNFGGFRHLPLKMQLAFTAVNEAYGWPVVPGPCTE